MPLYLVKDGINDIGCKTKDGYQLLETDFYLITYDFKTNEGYIEKKGTNLWRLYTQVGQNLGKSRYFNFSEFSECVNKLRQLNDDSEIVICKSTDVSKFIFKTNQ